MVLDAVFQSNQLTIHLLCAASLFAPSEYNVPHVSLGSSALSQNPQLRADLPVPVTPFLASATTIPVHKKVELLDLRPSLLGSYTLIRKSPRLACFIKTAIGFRCNYEPPWHDKRHDKMRHISLTYFACQYGLATLSILCMSFICPEITYGCIC